MALERQSIEKKDFPIGRRGYDPQAVDSHLASIAAEVEELKRSSRKRTETLASSASEQVRTIIEAAETSAAAIQSQAEDEAREIRTEATTEAQGAREQASAQAREYVGQVSGATTTMLKRIDAMEGELSALVEALRTGANRLNADLQLLEGNLVELNDSALPHSHAPDSAEVHERDEAGEGEDEAELERDKAGASSMPEPAVATKPDTADTAGEGSEDTEGARLIALNMALNGTPREETDRYLEDNFKLEDRHALLDDVYASVDG